MAAHAGKEGSVAIGAHTIALVRSYSLNTSTETADTTTLDNTDGYETHLATFSTWEGSVDCLWDETDSNGQGALIAGAAVTLNLYPEGETSGDTYYTGSATVTGITRSGEVKGIVETSFTFKGNGALTETTVA